MDFTLAYSALPCEGEGEKANAKRERDSEGKKQPTSTEVGHTTRKLSQEPSPPKAVRQHKAQKSTGPETALIKVLACSSVDADNSLHPFLDHVDAKVFRVADKGQPETVQARRGVGSD